MYVAKIAEYVVPVCLIFCHLHVLPKASVNDLDSSPNGKFLKAKLTVQIVPVL